MKKTYIPLLVAIGFSLSGCLQLSDNASPEPVEHVVKSQTVAEYVNASLMQDFGFKRHQAAGIVGNLAQESGQFHTLAEINGTCFGYSQWCGSRKSEFFEYAKNNGGKQSVEANYGFLRLEMSRDYPDMIERIKGTETVSASAAIFMREFLRPHKDYANLPRRIRYGQQYNSGDFSGSAYTDGRPTHHPFYHFAKIEAEQLNDHTFRFYTMKD